MDPIHSSAGKCLAVITHFLSEPASPVFWFSTLDHTSQYLIPTQTRSRCPSWCAFLKYQKYFLSKQPQILVCSKIALVYMPSITLPHTFKSITSSCQYSLSCTLHLLLLSFNWNVGKMIFKTGGWKWYSWDCNKDDIVSLDALPILETKKPKETPP